MSLNFLASQFEKLLDKILCRTVKLLLPALFSISDRNISELMSGFTVLQWNPRAVYSSLKHNVGIQQKNKSFKYLSKYLSRNITVVETFHSSASKHSLTAFLHSLAYSRLNFNYLPWQHMQTGRGCAQTLHCCPDCSISCFLFLSGCQAIVGSFNWKKTNIMS